MSTIIQITDEMKRQFQSETAEHLNDLEKLLMTIERSPNRADVIHAAFRYVHSIKGNSDYLGVRDINELAHIVEDLMDDVRGGRIGVSQPVLDLFFQGLDLLKDMNRRVADPDYRETDLSAVRSGVEGIRAGARDGASAPPDGAGDDARVGVSDVLEREIKVDIGKIDRFMEHMSEFAEAQNALQHLAQSIGDGGSAGARAESDIRAVSAAMKKVFNNFQADLMALRLVKLTTLFDRLARMVRDLSRRQGKTVELKLSGGDVAVDRKIMGALVDPLVHLVRNAVDHGIEPPAERRRTGKPEAGTLVVDARQEGVHVVIDVADDGRGLDTSRIRRAAAKFGFADADALSAMTDADAARLIFRAGFTTRKNADAVSGRGVGLDVVDSAVTAIGGSVGLAVDGESGVRVSLRVPISMTVTEVLLIRAGGEIYAVPFGGLRRVVRMRRDRVRGFKGARMTTWEGRIMTVRRLEDWLDPSGSGRAAPDADRNGDMPVIVAGVEGRTMGIEVDAVLRRENVVIRPMRRFLTGFRAFSGAAVLGDGRVVMVIDPMELASGR